jgi:hypothetical protein
VVNGQLSGTAGAAGTGIVLRTESLENTAAGQIPVSDSYGMLYDAGGRVSGRYQRRVVGGVVQDQVVLSSYDLRGNRQYEFYAQAVGGASQGIAKQYLYDAGDQLLLTRRYFALGTIKEVWVAPIDRPPGYVPEQVDAGGWLMYSEQFSYDQDGRMRWQETRGRETNFRYYQGAGGGSNQYTDLSLLNFNNRVDYTLADATADVNDNLSAYDAGGRLISYRYSSTGPGAPNGYTHTFSSSYEGWERWQETRVEGQSTATDYKATTNTLALDAFGRISTQSEHTETTQAGVYDRIRAYTYSGDGQVQTRRHGYWDSGFRQATKPDSQGNPIPQNYQMVYAAGQQMAELEAGGAARVTLPSSGLGAALASAFGIERGGLSRISSNAGSGAYSSGGGTVTVLEGETLTSLAQRVYGTATLWYVLADANGYSDTSATLTTGIQLKTPSVSVNSNDANTFRPYNANAAIGSTSPSLPYIPPPEKGAGCSTLALVLIVIIAVVVTVFTAGAAATAIAPSVAAAGGTVGTMAVGASVLAGTATGIGFGASVAVGAIAGAAGAAASMAAGSLMGVSTFSWRGVAAGAITGGLTAGFGAAANAGVFGAAIQQAGSTARIAAGAVAGNLGSAAANRLVGNDANFSWKSVAASALSAVVTAKIAPALTGRIGNDTVQDFAYGAIGSVVGYGTRRAFGFDEKFNSTAVINDGIGAVINGAAGRSKRDLAGRDQWGRRSADESLFADFGGDEFTAMQARSTATNPRADSQAASGTGTSSLASRSRKVTISIGNIEPVSGGSGSGGGTGSNVHRITSERELSNTMYDTHARNREWGEQYRSMATPPPTTNDDAAQKAWQYIHRTQWEPRLPEHRPTMVVVDPASVERNNSGTMKDLFGITPFQQDRYFQLAREKGYSEFRVGATMAAREAFYGLGNIGTLGFWGLHDNLLVARNSGQISESQYWSSTTVSATTRIFLLAGGGLGYGAVGGRIGGLAAGAAYGGGGDMLLQASDIGVNYLTDGKVGQASFSWKQTAISSVGGAVVGKFAASELANLPVSQLGRLKWQNPVLLERGAVLSSGGFGAIKDVRSPLTLKRSTSEGEGLVGKGWKFDSARDIDLRGQGSTWHDGIDAAFERIRSLSGVSRDQFRPIKRAYTSDGKSMAVEWEGPRGANVNLDIPELQVGEYGMPKGPSQPHIGWKAPGKNLNGRGHVFVDGKLPATRTRIDVMDLEF